MKQYLDSKFYSLKIDKNLPSNEKIKIIENLYEECLEYISINAVDQRQSTAFQSYAHVLFSKKILDYVSLDEFCEYIQIKEQIRIIQEEMENKRNFTVQIKRLTKK